MTKGNNKSLHRNSSGKNEIMSDIVIRGAREHNLRNVNLRIPRNRLICMTGVSGSGKSSLVNDIIVEAMGVTTLGHTLAAGVLTL